VSEVKKVKKLTKNTRLLDVYGELTRPNVAVLRMVLRVDEEGVVIVDECSYEEEVTTP